MHPYQIFFIALSIAALVFTVVAYPNKYGAQSGRSRLFRTVGVFLLDLLLLLVTLATFIDFTAGVSPRVAPIRAGFYLASCCFLCLALICTALLDSLESVSRLRRESRTDLEAKLRNEIDKAREEARRRKAASGESEAPTPAIPASDDRDGSDTDNKESRD